MLCSGYKMSDMNVNEEIQKLQTEHAGESHVQSMMDSLKNFGENVAQCSKIDDPSVRNKMKQDLVNQHEQLLTNIRSEKERFTESLNSIEETAKNFFKHLS